MERWDNGKSGGRPRVRRWGARLLPLLVGSLTLALAVVVGAQAKLTYIDLQPKANHKLSDDLHDSAGNNLANVPRGEQKLGDMTFQIGEKMIHIRGAHAQDVPEKVEIKVEAAFDKLHILHSTGYGEGPENAVADGTEIGAYIVQYADKSTERIPIRYGEEIRDWWENPEKPNVSKALIAWTGTNAAADQLMRKIRLYHVTWTNPHPDKSVATIDFQSSGTECDPFLVALTAEKK